MSNQNARGIRLYRLFEKSTCTSKCTSGEHPSKEKKEKRTKESKKREKWQKRKEIKKIRNKERNRK